MRKILTMVGVFFFTNKVKISRLSREIFNCGVLFSRSFKLFDNFSHYLGVVPFNFLSIDNAIDFMAEAGDQDDVALLCGAKCGFDGFSSIGDFLDRSGEFFAHA